MKTNSIGKKLIPTIIVVVLLMGLVNIISIYYIKKINNSYSDLIDRRTHILATMNDVQNYIYEQNANYRGYLLTNNLDYTKNFEIVNKKVLENLDQAIYLTKNKENKEKLKKLEDLYHLYIQRGDQVINSLSTDRSAAVNMFETSVLTISKEMINQAQIFADEQLRYMDGVSDANDVTVEFSNKVILIISSMGFIIATSLIGYISRSLLMKLVID